MGNVQRNCILSCPLFLSGEAWEERIIPLDTTALRVRETDFDLARVVKLSWATNQPSYASIQ